MNENKDWVMGKRGKLYDKELMDIASERLNGIDRGHKKMIGSYRLENAILKDEVSKAHWKVIKKRLIHDIPRQEDVE